MSLLTCFSKDGSLDAYKYYKKMRGKRDERAKEIESLVELCINEADSERRKQSSSSSSKARAKRGHSMPMKLGPNNEMIPMDPKETIWWQSHVASGTCVIIHCIKSITSCRRRLMMAATSTTIACWLSLSKQVDSRSAVTIDSTD